MASLAIHLMTAFIIVIVIHVSSNPYDVTLQRTRLKYFNPKYMEWGNVTTTRFSRRSPYYLNVEGYIKQVWGNNVSIDLVFYELLSNQYRRSFVEMHFKLCNMMRNDPYVGGLLKKALGLKCPYAAGPYHLMNMTVPMEAFQNVWPFQSGRVTVTLRHTDNNDTIAEGFGDITFTEIKKKKQ